VLDDKDQAQSSTKKTSSRTSRAPKRYGIWADFSLLKDSDFIGKQENKDALILKEWNHSSYNKARTCEAKFELNVVMDKEMQSLQDNGT
jgi:hypothetical protein